jgi:hypothetical protein
MGAMNRDGETTLSVDEPNDPVRFELEPRPCGFLLIVRTGRIVTVHVDTLKKVYDMNEYRRILGVSSIQLGFRTALKVDRYSSRCSPYRYGAWTISSSRRFKRELCVWPLRIPEPSVTSSRPPRTMKLLVDRIEPARQIQAFPADCPHRSDCHCLIEASTAGYSGFPAFSRVCSRGLPHESRNGVYGRRLPGLSFRALLPKELTLPRNLPAPGRRQCVYIVLRLRTHLCF